MHSLCRHPLLLLHFFFHLNPDGVALLSLNSATDHIDPSPSPACLTPTSCNWTGVSSSNVSGDLQNPCVVALSGFNDLQRLILFTNQLSGDIPGGILPTLVNLAQLDLSMNQFIGPIPMEIGKLKSLSGKLNLSNNYFSGDIPASLENLPVTVSLDIRNTNLSGGITQTGSFSNQGPTAFLENPLLCGFPLQKTCENKSPAATRDPQDIVVTRESAVIHPPGKDQARD